MTRLARGDLVRDTRALCQLFLRASLSLGALFFLAFHFFLALLKRNSAHSVSLDNANKNQDGRAAWVESPTTVVLSADELRRDNPQWKIYLDRLGRNRNHCRECRVPALG